MEVNKIEEIFSCLESECDKMVEKITKNKEEI